MNRSAVVTAEAGLEEVRNEYSNRANIEQGQPGKPSKRARKIQQPEDGNSEDDQLEFGIVRDQEGTEYTDEEVDALLYGPTEVPFPATLPSMPSPSLSLPSLTQKATCNETKDIDHDKPSGPTNYVVEYHSDESAEVSGDEVKERSEQGSDDDEDSSDNSVHKGEDVQSSTVDDLERDELLMNWKTIDHKKCEWLVRDKCVSCLFQDYQKVCKDAFVSKQIKKVDAADAMAIIGVFAPTVPTSRMLSVFGYSMLEHITETVVLD
ncbi:hypothetical protein BGX27_003430, partial [Mortierella sp. AM989]